MKTYSSRIEMIADIPPGSIGCEVGVWRGYFSIEILNKTAVAKLYLVDAWMPQPGYNDPLSDTDHEANLAECKHHLRGHPGRFVIVRGSSVDVAEHNTDIPELDWVYIDADHGYDACKADLIAWAKKIKPGGCIIGHDYTNNEQAQKWGFGVIRAVHDFCRDHGWQVTALTNEDFASFKLERVSIAERDTALNQKFRASDNGNSVLRIVEQPNWIANVKQRHLSTWQSFDLVSVAKISPSARRENREVALFLDEHHPTGDLENPMGAVNNVLVEVSAGWCNL